MSSLIQEELSRIVMREVEFPLDSLVTITGVEVSKELDTAKVMISVLPSESAADVLLKLGESAGYLQRLLMKKINIKPMPKIHFELDRGLENAAAIEKRLLDNK